MEWYWIVAAVSAVLYICISIAERVRAKKIAAKEAENDGNNNSRNDNFNS